MKKLYSALLVIALAASMVLPIMAAPSPKADVVAPAKNVTVAVAGAEAKTLPADRQEAVNAVVGNKELLAAWGIKGNVKVATTFDLTYSGTIPAGGLQIPIKVANAQAGDYVYVLHRIESDPNHPWEIVGQGYLGADLTVVGTFTCFSPVAVMIADAPQQFQPASDAPQQSQSAAGVVKAPKTGEF